MTTGTWLNAQLGTWRLVEFLGAGGMGEVYRGVDSQSGESVAVKLLTTVRGSDALRARFANEAKIHSGLSHPAIATMIAFASHNGTPAIVMEYVDGVTIESSLASHGPMPLARAIDSMQELVAAIDYLHRRGTVHRDIKSSNVKITRSGHVKLLDFGIAKGPDSPALTADGSVIGTLQSLAPEQLFGAPADAQSEIWALGVLFYEMLTARHPFAGAEGDGITGRIRAARYPAPTAARPGLPPIVDVVISRCLQVDPRARYASCAALRADVERLRTPNWVSTGRRLDEGTAAVRRHGPLLIAATLALLAIGFAFSGLSSRGAVAGGDSVRVASGRDSLAASVLIPAGPMRDVTINTLNGTATVWQDGVQVGETPYLFRIAIGGEVHVTLQRAGYHDEDVRFHVTEGRSEYSFVLRPLPGRPHSSRSPKLTLLLGFAWFGLPWRRRRPPVRPVMETIDRPAFQGDGLGVESRVVVGTASDPGCLRTNNEDAVRVVRPPNENSALLAMVCDGMGGHAGGEQASRIAADTIALRYREEGEPGEVLADAVRCANREVYRTAAADTALRGMGTTCTALVLRGGLAWCAHVGDSRCYLIRAKEIFVMTEDHSAVMELVRDGTISRDEAREHPDKNVISRALGSHAEVEVATWPRPFVIRPGDRFLLSSDGLHDVITEAEILRVVDSLPPHLACQELVTLTRAAGAPDNVSVVILGLPLSESEVIGITQAARIPS